MKTTVNRTLNDVESDFEDRFGKATALNNTKPLPDTPQHQELMRLLFDLCQDARDLLISLSEERGTDDVAFEEQQPFLDRYGGLLESVAARLLGSTEQNDSIAQDIARVAQYKAHLSVRKAGLNNAIVKRKGQREAFLAYAV